MAIGKMKSKTPSQTDAVFLAFSLRRAELEVSFAKKALRKRDIGALRMHVRDASQYLSEALAKL